ncbi:MAG: DUF4190 domain-containing protein [Tepidisphaeraceae bacterium]
MTAPAQPELPPNPLATKAAIVGVLSIIPGVGVVAIVLGLLAGNRARMLRGAGRGRAMLAMVFGVGSLFLWAMLLGALLEYRAMTNYGIPADKATRDFIRFVGSGNVNAARQLCTDAIDDDKLTNTVIEINDLGSFVGEIRDGGGRPVGDNYEVNYLLPFAKGERRMVCEWKFIDGKPMLAKYELTVPPSTQPATNPS